MKYNRSVLSFLIALAAFAFTVNPISAQQQSPDLLWRQLAARPAGVAPAKLWVTPKEFAAVTLDHAAMRAALARAPLESALTAAKSAPATASEITLPLPDGTFQRFTVVESPVMAPELAALFPEIKTYYAQGVDDPAATARLDLTPAGFHAQILSPHGAVYIDPHLRDASVYAAYYKKDYRRAADGFRCFTPTRQTVAPLTAARTAARSGTNLRTYRLACAADGEYTAFHGGTVSNGFSAIVSAVNRVTGVYETELAIRLVLVANNQLLVYTNAATDPYTDADGSLMLDQNQTNIDHVIGNANYDIGHVFSTGGGGIAGVEVVCVTGQKANGVTGNTSPMGDSFWIDFVAHEMGHQFGGDHTFNSSAGNCGGNIAPTAAYEPGSGSTIMAYAGICGTDDLQAHSDPYFHAKSFDEIIAYSTTGSGNSCPVTTATGNTVPTVSAGANYTIPAGTPFILTASGSDANGDALTYCWEERDLGPSTTLTAPDNGSSPLFRSFNPTTNNWRLFPQLTNILANNTTPGEIMPATTRTLNFRVTARDNRAAGGGVNTADMQVAVTNTGSAFAVTSLNTSNTFAGATTVTWNIAQTTNTAINVANVKITLSTNGGTSFSIGLAASTPNDGSELVTLPSLTTHAARVKVEALGNIFFDINNLNFSIIPGAPAPVLALDPATLTAENCTGTNNAVDPGETVTCQFALRNIGGASTTNLVATLLATGGVTAPGGAQTYGALAPGGAAGTRPFTFTANGTCGGTITVTLHLQDGAADLGNVTQTIPLGQTATLWSENFDGITAPALPAGWTTAGGGGQAAWFSRTTASDTAPNAMFSANAATIGTNTLVTPAITLPAGSSQLTFRQNYDLESGYDGGVLEIKIGAGAFTDIITAGGSFVAGGYNAALSTSYGNPLGGRSAWTGTSGSFITTTVNLPAGASGQTVQFRWRCATDDSTAGTGWYVDSFAITGPVCCVGAPSITTQPQNQTVVTNTPASFFVSAAGTAPLGYQWYFNSNIISGATATNHVIASVQGGNVGNYFVVVSNAISTVTSTVVKLTIAGTNATTVVISQVYGGGGNAGATYKNDFVELFNPTAASVNLSTWSVQYAASSGIVWSKANLTGSIQPYHYYLVQFGSNGVVGATLPIADATNAINVSAVNGKIALVNNQTALTGANPVGTASVVDFVGYGTANGYEGTAAAPAGSSANTNSIVRKNGGNTDSNDNAADFTTATPSPRNSAAAANPPPAPAAAPGFTTLSFASNQFQFTLTGTAGSNYIVQATTNLAMTNWLPVRTGAAPFLFIESNAGTFPQRYYRGKVAP